MSLGLVAADQTYTQCYCEENVWHLCKTLVQRSQTQLSSQPVTVYAVFISNEVEQVALWRQCSGRADLDGLVLWDYHVVALAVTDNTALVYDLDTTLPFPCTLDQYHRESLRASPLALTRQCQRLYRVVPALSYLTEFASDRSHMFNARANQWFAPPPSYDCISSATMTMNLDEYRKIPGGGSGIDSTVYDEKTFIETFITSHQ